MRSLVKPNGKTSFPLFTGEQIYQVPFILGEKLPEYLQRWQSTVDNMTRGLNCEGEAYLMIDQADVLAGMSHRRSGLHIDGNWIPDVQCHGHGNPFPSHVHHKEPTPHKGVHDTPRASHVHDSQEPGMRFSPLSKGGLILASNVSACRAFTGEFEGEIGEGW